MTTDSSSRAGTGRCPRIRALASSSTEASPRNVGSDSLLLRDSDLGASHLFRSSSWHTAGGILWRRTEDQKAPSNTPAGNRASLNRRGGTAWRLLGPALLARLSRLPLAAAA